MTPGLGVERAPTGYDGLMSQYEQENDLGAGGGEVDEETMEDAWRNAAERRSTANEGDGEEEGEQ